MRPNEAVVPFSVRLLGPFEAQVGGRPLPRLTFRRSLAVLAMLILRHGCEVERGWLSALLWPESPGTQALRNSLTDLRQALGPEAGRLRSPTSRTLSFDLAGADVDVLAFDAAIARGDPEALEEAVALYRGPLMEGYAEEWFYQERQTREQAYLAARETLAAHARTQDDLAAAERHLRAALSTDLLREQSQRALMELLAANGNYAAALVAYRELRARLHREANVEPDPETQALFHRLRAEAQARNAALASPRWSNGAAGDWHSEPPIEASPNGGFPHRLPIPLTSFIGRQAEMAALQQQLAAHRLVTLTGMGGSGKTRLAIEVATSLASAYPDGVGWVELAPLADSTLVPQRVAAALGLRESPDRPLIETLIEALKPKPVLLLLDNCEHLIEVCAQLAETLLQACAHLRILATSREPLGIAGEQPFRVPSLSLPATIEVSGSSVLGQDDRSLDRDLSTLNQSEAVRLFVERAATAQPGFTLTARNAVAVAQVCARLDGIPLAIELAVARLKALPVEQLSQRLGDMFGLLTGGSRTALPRHQTLRALIDWSYDLLTSAEQALLRRLSVFAGGWTLAAAEAVCGGDALNLLTRLVEKSLVIYEEREGEGRYRFLEMIREYAREQLAACDEREQLRERHGRFFLALAETAEPELAGSDQVLWLDRLERDLDNVRATFVWSVESQEIDLGLRLGSALERFWQTRGHMREGRSQLLRLLAKSGAATPDVARARALSTVGLLTSLQGDPDIARDLLEESLALWRRLEDRAGIAAALQHLGWMAEHPGDLTTARPLAEESLALCRDLGEARGLADALALAAAVRHRDGDPTARSLIEESIEICRALEDRVGTIRGLATLARWATDGGDLNTARCLYEEVLAVASELGDRPRVAWALFGLGEVAQVQKELATACTFFERSLPLWQELDDKLGLIKTRFHLGHALKRQGHAAAAYERFAEILAIAREANWRAAVAESLAFLGATAGDLGRWDETAARCAASLELCTAGETWDHHIAIEWAFIGLTDLALACGKLMWAARLLGAAEVHLDGSIPEHERAAAATRAQMEPAEFEAAWVAGRAAPLEQIIAEALEEARAV